jgi:hypothetical protein
MRLIKEQLVNERETRRKMEAGQWFATRWWRLVSEDGELLAESSSEDEIRQFAAQTEGSVVQHLYEKHKRMWRDAT